jgi:hypothetical protein
MHDGAIVRAQAASHGFRLWQTVHQHLERTRRARVQEELEKIVPRHWITKDRAGQTSNFNCQNQVQTASVSGEVLSEIVCRADRFDAGGRQ